MDFTMDDDTFHFCEDNTEYPLNISLLDELDAPTEANKSQDAASGNEANVVSDESSDAVDAVECEQQDNFPFIEGTEPSDELRATLRKCHAYAHFYEMPSVTQSLERSLDSAGLSRAWTPCWRPVLRTVAVVGLHTLLLGDGDRWTTASLGSALTEGGRAAASPVKRVVVHHELQPTVRRYLALLQEDLALTVLSFPQLKVVSRYSSVASVTSVDENWKGLPSLQATKCSGERVRWSPLYSDAADVEDTEPAPPAAKLQVAKILQSKLHAACDRLQRLESSCRQREVFISTHVDKLRGVLAGGDDGSDGGGGGPELPFAKTALPSVTAGDVALCRVVSVRCKILHSRTLLVCAAVSNSSPRLLLSDLELVLNLQSEHHADRTSSEPSGLPHLEYKSYVYKSVMRVSKQKSAAAANKSQDDGGDETRGRAVNDESFSKSSARAENDSSGPRVRVGTGGGDIKSGTHIELLSPCLLRPNKQAYVIGVCRMPTFSSGRYLNITGLVRFKTKPLSLQDKKLHASLSFQPGEISNASKNIREKPAASNRCTSPTTRGDFCAGKRKEFVSPESVTHKRPDPATAPPKEESVAAVEEFICRNGGVFLKSRYPKYGDKFSECFYQVPIKTISIDALKIDSIKVSLTLPPPRAGVSLDSLALVAGSERCRVLLQSPICGLAVDRLLARLALHCDVKQVADVCNVYVLCPAEPSASLHHCALSLYQELESCISADLYFRDLHQGLTLIHTLKAALPFDAVISPVNAAAHARASLERGAGVLAEEDRVKKLYEKMYQAAQFLSKGIRDKFDLKSDRQEQTKKKSKMAEDLKSHDKTHSAAEMYDEKRKLFLDSGAGFTVDRATYEEWRLELRTLVAELDEAYLDIHECDW